MGAVDAVGPGEAHLHRRDAAAQQLPGHRAEVGCHPELGGGRLDRRRAVQHARAASQDLLGAVAQHPFGTGVEERDPALLVGHDDRDARRARHDAVQGVALGLRVPRRLDALPHPQDEGHHDDRAHDRERGQQDPPQVPVESVDIGGGGERAPVGGREQDGEGQHQDHLRQRLVGGDAQRAPGQERDEEVDQRRGVLRDEDQRRGHRDQQPLQRVLPAAGDRVVRRKGRPQRRQHHQRGEVGGAHPQRDERGVTEPGDQRRQGAPGGTHRTTDQAGEDPSAQVRVAAQRPGALLATGEQLPHQRHLDGDGDGVPQGDAPGPAADTDGEQPQGQHHRQEAQRPAPWREEERTHGGPDGPDPDDLAVVGGVHDRRQAGDRGDGEQDRDADLPGHGLPAQHALPPHDPSHSSAATIRPPRGRRHHRRRALPPTRSRRSHD